MASHLALDQVFQVRVLAPQPYRSHRLVAQDTALSRRKRGFEPRWDRQEIQRVTGEPVAPFFLLPSPLPSSRKRERSLAL